MLATSSESVHDLYLKCITVENFKSYYGKHTIGDFHRDFTSIVGSNGSGKSNVIDSLLFVFGFRSNYLRHQKLSNLIYSGHIQANFCTVALEFHRFNEIYTISRRVDINNGSNYYVNDKQTPFQQVKALVNSWGIDLEHNRFMILQGEIESIAQMKPIGSTVMNGIPTPNSNNSVGLLEYLEDIIGTTQFHEPLHAAFTGVQSIEEDLQKQNTQLHLAQKQLDQLEPQYKEAVHYCHLKNHLSTLQKDKYTHEMEQCTQDILDCQTEIKNQETLHKDVGLNLTNISTEIKEFTKQLTKTPKSNPIQHHIHELEQQIVKYEQNKSHHQSGITTKCKQLETIEKDLSQLQYVDPSTCTTIEQEIAQINKKLKVESKQLNQHRLQLKQKLLPIEQQIDAVQQQINPIASQLTLLSNNLSLKIKSPIQNPQQMLQDKKEELQVLEPLQDQLQQQLNELNDKSSSFEQQIDNVQQILFEQQQQQQPSSNNHFSHLKCTYYGRLGDLGTIDPKYDAAISSASGSFYHHVVQSIEDANICIAYIKEKQLSRCTFMVLDKLKNTPKSKSNHKRLFDVIQCEEKYKSAFYEAVQETIIAESLEQGQHLNKQGNRVVTLKGIVLERSGVTSGGGKVQTGAMLLAGQKPLKTKTKTTKEYKGPSVEELQSQLEQLLNKKQQLALELEDVSECIVQCQLGIEQYTVEVEQYESAIKNRDTQLKKNQQIKLEMSELQLQLDPLQLKLQEHQLKLKSIGGPQLEQQQIIVDQLTRDIEGLTSRLKEMKSQQQNYHKHHSKLKQKSQSLEKSIQQHHTALKKEEKLLKDSQLELKEKKDEWILIQQQEEKQSQLHLQLKKKIQQQSKFKQEMQQIEITMKELTSHVKELNLQLKKLQQCHDELVFYTLNEEIPSSIAVLSLKAVNEKIKQSTPNLSCLEQYQSLTKKVNGLQQEQQGIKGNRDQMRLEFDQMTLKRQQTFMTGFYFIQQQLKKIYNQLTMGGNAELDLVDSLNPFTEGITFSVMPPKKSWKLIKHLSGGEKTLSSLALVYALHAYKPCPLYVMDEIDAALDFKNVGIVAQYCKEQSKQHAQMIIISLRTPMFDRADKLVGIYKIHGCTKSITTDLNALKYDKFKIVQQEIKKPQRTRLFVLK